MSTRTPAAPDAATSELDALKARRDEAARHLRDLQSREIVLPDGPLDQARAAVVDAERRLVLGDDRAAADLDAARLVLDAAEHDARPASPEQLAGARAAAREAVADVARFVADRFDDLTPTFDDEARRLADDMTATMNQLVDLFLQREQLAQRYANLAGHVTLPEPGLVARTRCETVIRAAQAVLAAGGEAAPLLTRDPRVPRAGRAA